MKVSLLIETKGLSSFGDVKVEYGADLITTRVYVPSLNMEIPIIPGTQVKGCLRTAATSIHNILAEKNVISWNTKYFSKCLGSLKNPCRKCLVCTVFGYSGASQTPLYVTNFYPVKADKVREIVSHSLIDALQKADYWLIPETVFITRTRIDDDKGTVHPGALYTYEHIYPGTLFYGEVHLHRNLLVSGEVRELGRLYFEASILVLASIAQLNYVTIGRNSICSFKIIKVEPKELTLNRYVKAILEECRGG